MLLEVSDLSAWYGDMPALRQVRLSLDRGELVSVVGSNGAGKTTLLRTLGGLHDGKRGSIRLNGHEVSRLPSHRLVDMGVVLVPEGRDIFPRMTVLENLQLGASSPRSAKHRKENLKRILTMMPILANRRGQMAGTLSGGEQQMLAIGRGLMSDPTVLLLDEPSLGLAPVLVQEVLELVDGIHRERSIGVILVEQNVGNALAISDRAYVLENGSVALEGKADAIAGDQRVKQAYLGL